MHHVGIIEKLLHEARREATERGGALQKVRVRLGALASHDADHFREDFVHARGELGFGDVELEVELAPERPSGVELIGIEVRAAASEG
ncbi:MAG: hypothetical protein KF901_14215 [Myxococcales bacterium]|nr:hypothetical protein [Myxococcales bacterium]